MDKKIDSSEKPSFLDSLFSSILEAAQRDSSLPQLDENRQMCRPPSSDNISHEDYNRMAQKSLSPEELKEARKTRLICETGELIRNLDPNRPYNVEGHPACPGFF